VATADRISPIFPVRDVAAATAFYAGLGFATRVYDGAEYGFAVLGDVELHLGGPPHSSEPTPHSAYLYVDDADELAARWTAAGADVRQPVDTPWGRHEGVLIDLDGNLIRFGSPMSGTVG
jgi:predicted enzyme related to lactoylglutathione lyase